ncbi:spermidine synthase [Phakopsora pachyrhizi]|uniref:Saccharopine dehydrogenase [NADP(+), L-glutamate-forming] n=1 Tax=Phakopsora pachyrhizi TaxID=170000 RepID=A0AAV0BAB2_PHAPC|nr:spermidine synthase [Phakopsora pachyrhizi]CAH7682696.1 spermidine synthase [Phakopsora pachyrhizi]
MSQSLSHPAVKDGWFREESSLWPGQAMCLQVKKILHVEKSKFQDVLVFESVAHGNVLVLDGAIQCVENDEFSYQEMIAHLPLNSHPNPENVLVIGGGDGGVLREVLKHPSVKSAVLCDIDEAVPRVSKTYLPHMAAGFNDPRVQVYIGDGFQYLKDKVGQFDVIITDSSDPNEGPAQTLFGMPYFELLKNALKPNGSISTQGECIWLHLPLIHSLVKGAKDLFPKVEYAFTSIPTYPSGTIGFVVCSLDKDRNLKQPLRQIRNTRYYNKNVHKSAFVLPEFAQAAVEAAKLNLALPTENSSSTTPKKKILILGSGFVAQPAADYILRRPENQLTIASRNISAARKFAEELSREANYISLDISDSQALDEAVSEHDLIVSLVPYVHHVNVIKSAIRFKKNVVTTSYVSQAMSELDSEVKKAGITVMNEIGLDPGIDHLYAVKTIESVHEAGGKITGFISYCCGLPAPECSNNPLGYKFSWSSRGVLLALLNSAKFYSNGKLVEVEGRDLMDHAKPYYLSPAFSFVAYPNRDSTPFREFYSIPEAQTVVRGSMRYQGFPSFVKVLVDIGFLNEIPLNYLDRGCNLSWKEVTRLVLGVKDSNENSLVDEIKKKAKFDSAEEEARIISGLKWIGIFSEEKVIARGNILDTLCATLETKMQYEKNERDMVALQHKFEIEWKDGSKETRTATLLEYGAPFHTGSGPSAMARLVGIPCGIATQMILDGKIKKTGVLRPYTKDLVEPLLEEVEKEGITLIEAIVS